MRILRILRILNIENIDETTRGRGDNRYDQKQRETILNARAAVCQLKLGYNRLSEWINCSVARGSADAQGSVVANLGILQKDIAEMLFKKDIAKMLFKKKKLLQKCFSKKRI